jgi:hypothetical protein
MIGMDPKTAMRMHGEVTTTLMVGWLPSTGKPSNSDSRVRTRTGTDQNECLIPIRTSLCVFEVDGVKL